MVIVVYIPPHDTGLLGRSLPAGNLPQYFRNVYFILDVLSRYIVTVFLAAGHFSP